MSTTPARARSLAVTALVALLVAACSSGTTADGLAGLVRDQPLDVDRVVLPEAASGAPTPLRAEPGGLALVFFGFLNCPDVCPTTMADVATAIEALPPAERERVTVRFVTVDPQRDQPEQMQDYLGYFFEEATALRTEDPEVLAEAQQAFLASSRIVELEGGGVDVEHTATVFVVDDQGRVVVEWAFGTSPDAMRADLELLLAGEAA